MTIEVFAADEQSGIPIDLERWVSLAKAVLSSRRVVGEAELSLLFVEEEAMAELNKRFMGKDGPTDVLAFPIDDQMDELAGLEENVRPGIGGRPSWHSAPTLLGDVVLCPSRAQQNAAERGESLEDELALLVVHGILHVLGMDHANEEDAVRMEAVEQEMLDRFYRPAVSAGEERTVSQGVFHETTRRDEEVQ